MKKKVFYNSITSVINQILTLICGFILPRIILERYGSETNGLLNSITSFFAFVSFMDFGVGAVVQSSLYKPLANGNYDDVSVILASASKFFEKIAFVILAYTVLLIIAFPTFTHNSFGFFFSGTLILSISVSYFFQFYIGAVDRLLLFSDQKGYITFLSHSVSVVLSTIMGVLIINHGGSIQLVKLSASLVFLARVAIVRLYISQHYQVNRKAEYITEPLQQKWNGFAQHLSSVVLDSTDTIVLTLFATLSDVSIYAIYYLVINAIKQFLYSLTVGVQAALGELIAKDKDKELKLLFKQLEWVAHNLGVFFFGCSAILIAGFVDVYTQNVSDANYHLPLFALCISLTGVLYSVRLPYNHLLLASGHFKQTQHYYVIAVVINLALSVAAVNKFGLIGVTIGTIIALLYHTCCILNYDIKHIVDWGIKSSIRLIVMDVFELLLGVMLTSRYIDDVNCTIYDWLIKACLVSVIWLLIIVTFNCIFFRSEAKAFLKTITQKRAIHFNR